MSAEYDKQFQRIGGVRKCMMRVMEEYDNSVAGIRREFLFFKLVNSCLFCFLGKGRGATIYEFSGSKTRD